TGDLVGHGDAGTLAEPRLEDPVDPLAVTFDERDMKLVAGLSADPGNGRSAAPPGRDPQTMELTPIPDGRAVGETTPGGELGTLAGEALEVASDPRVAASEEHLDLGFRVRPPTTRRRWDRDDESKRRVDRDGETSRPV